MDLSIDNRTALVAGSTSGLGLAAAKALAHEGARVVICGRRGEVATAEARVLPAAHAIEIDLARHGEPERLVKEATEHFGAVDILVLNSGGPAPGSAESASPDEFEDALKHLCLQQVRLINAVLPSMRQQGWGRIIAIGSSGIQQPLANLALSNVGRSALAAYLKTLSREVAREGVTVNMVLPGRIDTGRVAALDRKTAEREGISPQEARSRSEASIPAQRYGSVEEYGAVVAFLCGSQASYITGEQVRCDGGLVSSF